MIVTATNLVFMRDAFNRIRNNCDGRTAGELFLLYGKKIEDIKFSHSLMLILSTVVQIRENSLNVRKNKIQDLITETFMNALPN